MGLVGIEGNEVPATGTTIEALGASALTVWALRKTKTGKAAARTSKKVFDSISDIFSQTKEA